MFSFKGVTSGFVKEDISTLISYVAIDRFLKPKGHLSFIVKESLFKSAKQATGFRNFYLKTSQIPFAIVLVEDLTSFKPFPKLTTKTVIFYATKGTHIQFPIDFIIWKPLREKSINGQDSVENIYTKFEFQHKLACPLKPSQQNSNWCSLSPDLYTSKNKYLGFSSYRARIGVFTGGANGIYCLRILKEVTDDIVTIENLTEKAKIKFNRVQINIEKKILYPYMAGSEISFWSSSYSKYIPCPHSVKTKMYPFPKEELKEKYPLTYDFFEYFKKGLQTRKGFTSLDKAIHNRFYYTLQRIGDYTFSPYKVAWRYISSQFISAVIEDVEDEYLGITTVIPNEKISYIGLNDRREAYYLCAILSSTIFQELINSFIINTQITPSIIEGLKLSQFNSNNILHVEISNLCEKGHRNQIEKDSALKQIDKIIPIIMQ